MFEAPLRECAKKGCCPPLDIKPVEVLPSGEAMFQFIVLGSGLQRRSFEFVIRQNCETSPGLVISDTARHQEKNIWNNRPPTVIYSPTIIASAANVEVCLEEFRSYFHIAMFKRLCLSKHPNSILGQRLDDIERLDLHYETLKTALGMHSDDLDKVRDRLAAVEERLKISEERWVSSKKRRTVE